MPVPKDKEACCGCCACADACPAGAITLVADAEGFSYSQVNASLCTRCGACSSVCPFLRPDAACGEGASAPASFAAIHKNMEVRFDSSAGGLFSAFASFVYRKGGCVGGAVFNDDLSVAHVLSSDKRDLSRLRGAKDAQSHAAGFYKAVRSALDEGRWVLACGAPCQMAALRLFLRKDYERLILVDFMCDGAASPKIVSKYLAYLEGRFQAKVASVRAKNKELGWRNLTSKVVFNDGQTLYDTKDVSLFTRGRLGTHAFSRPACYACPFRGLPRAADLTLADLWDAAKTAGAELDQDLGTCLALLNTPKAEAFFSQVSEGLLSKPVSFERWRAEHPEQLAPLPRPAVDRKRFYASIDADPFDVAVQRALDQAAPPIGAQHRFRAWRRGLTRTLKRIRRVAGLNPTALCQVVKYNVFSKAIQGPGLLIPRRASVLAIQPKASVRLSENLIFGVTHLAGSRLESRLFVENGASLVVSQETRLGYGADVEVFSPGELIFNGVASNIGLTIICGERIVLGAGVKIGRNVTIRDNNGSHFLSMPGYKTSKPVEIGEHAWLCEGCTIMPGVKIGVGAIIGAKAVVFNNVPAHALVLGNPAEVVLEDVYWKY